MLAMVGGGSGSPSEVPPARPAVCRSHWNGAPSASSAASADSMISGPMPSPAISVAGIDCVIGPRVSSLEGEPLAYSNSAQFLLHRDELDALSAAEIVTHRVPADVAPRRVEPRARQRRHELDARETARPRFPLA